MQEIELHYNHPQIRSMLVGAPDEWLVAGRGTGKTEGVLAPKSLVYLHGLPRSCGVLLGATYTQILVRTLPGLIYGWEKLGYKKDVHFIVGKRPPEKWVKFWNWKGPYRAPLKFDYFISWWNGSGIHLVSQDRSGSSNGITIDWINGDEAKLLNRDRFVTELLPANRGLIRDYMGNPYHHGMTFTTDMPVGTGGRWILEKELEMDRKRVQEILNLQSIIYTLQAKATEANSKSYQAYVKEQCGVLMDEIKELRNPTKNAPRLLYYHEASSLDNIHALGEEYFKDQVRNSSIFELDTQILNIRPKRLGDGFYPDLDEEIHGYYAYNYDYIDTLGYGLKDTTLDDCRKDNDLQLDKPLEISLDYNKKIWPIEVIQETDTEIKVINSLHVLYPDKLRQALEKLDRYYKYHKCRVIIYWYDHTATSEYDKTPIYQDVIDILTELKWTVIPMAIGLQPLASTRYRMYGDLLQEPAKKYSKVLRINRENCKFLLLSMNQTVTVATKGGFGKDKAYERNTKLPPEEAPHHSDALDTILYGKLESGINIHQGE